MLVLFLSKDGPDGKVVMRARRLRDDVGDDDVDAKMVGVEDDVVVAVVVFVESGLAPVRRVFVVDVCN